MVSVRANAKQALDRLRERLWNVDPNVKALYSLEEDGEVFAWAVLEVWDRESRLRLFEQRFEADPDLLVNLRLTDNLSEIPDDAEQAFRR